MFSQLSIAVVLVLVALTEGCKNIAMRSELFGNVEFTRLPVSTTDTANGNGRARYVSVQDVDSNSSTFYLYHELVTTDGIGRWIIHNELGDVENASMFANSWAVAPHLGHQAADGIAWNINVDGIWKIDESVEVFCKEDIDGVVFFDSFHHAPLLSGFFIEQSTTATEGSPSSTVYTRIKSTDDENQLFLFPFEDKWLIGETVGIDSCIAFVKDAATKAEDIESKTWFYNDIDNGSDATWIENDGTIVTVKAVAGVDEPFPNIYSALRYHRSIKYIPEGQTYFTLRNNVPMPTLGFGTGGLAAGAQTNDAITAALRSGYRLLDSAREYRNEAALPKIFALAETEEVTNEPMPLREEVFIVSKVWPTELGFVPTSLAIEKSLRALKTEYVDLYLIHWPSCNSNVDWMHCETTVDENGDWISSWNALEKAFAEGRVNAIGVSNFGIELLMQFEDPVSFSVLPHVVQNFGEPGDIDKDVLDWCQRENVAFQPYASLRNLHNNHAGDDEHKASVQRALTRIAHAHGVSEHSVALRFMIQAGTTPIPRSSQVEHIKENLDVFSWELLGEEMDELW